MRSRCEHYVTGYRDDPRSGKHQAMVHQSRQGIHVGGGIGLERAVIVELACVDVEISEMGGLQKIVVSEAVAVEHDSRRGLDRSDAPLDRKSTRLNSSHIPLSRMPSSA